MQRQSLLNIHGGSAAQKVPPGTANLAPRPTCRVLPPGEFTGLIQQPLQVYSESLTTANVTVA